MFTLHQTLIPHPNLLILQISQQSSLKNLLYMVLFHLSGSIQLLLLYVHEVQYEENPQMHSSCCKYSHAIY